MMSNLRSAPLGATDTVYIYLTGDRKDGVVAAVGRTRSDSPVVCGDYAEYTSVSEAIRAVRSWGERYGCKTIILPSVEPYGPEADELAASRAEYDEQLAAQIAAERAEQ